MFPTIYDAEYDQSVQRLVLQFLSKLEQLLPIPDLQQVLRLHQTPVPVGDCQKMIIVQLVFRRRRGWLRRHGWQRSWGNTCVSLLPWRRFCFITDRWRISARVGFPHVHASALRFGRPLSRFLSCSSAPSSSGDDDDNGGKLQSALTLPGVTYAHINIYTECLSDANDDREEIVAEHFEEDSSVGARKPKTKKKKKVIGRRKGIQEESGKQGNFGNKKGWQKRALSGVDRRFLITRPVEKTFPERDTKCSKCEKVFELPNQLTTHMRLHSFPYSCIQCEKGFISLSGYYQHQRVHKRGRKFICGQCNKGFLCGYSLRQHQQLHQGPSNTCTICGKAFSKSGFVRHMQMHRGEKNHLCTVCGKSFLSSGELLLHTRSHTGEVPHTCTHCGKGFSTKGHLIVHMRSHTGERPYQCSLCPKRFLTLGCVKRHMLSHNGEKPFRCPTCEKEFSQQGNMKRHLATHNNDPWAFIHRTCDWVWTRCRTMFFWCMFGPGGIEDYNC